MIKLLIVDDEPLVQVGIKSMIDWGSMGIEICGIAGNGDVAYEITRQQLPEIVITDIKMPRMSGLELAKKCRENFGKLPVFIILTSYEEFEYAKEALSFQAIDYLIKLELTAQSLTESVEKALTIVTQEQQNKILAPNMSITDLQVFRERFFVRLLNNLFENTEQFETQAADFNITFDSAGYAAAHMEICSKHTQITTSEHEINIYNSTLQMFRELIAKYISCEVVSLDIHYFTVIFFIQENDLVDVRTYLRNILIQTFEMVFNYYSVQILCSIGRVVSTPLELTTSYHDARQISSFINKDEPLMFFEDLPKTRPLRNVFNLSIFRTDIREAFEELDEEALHCVFSNITELLSRNTLQYAQALDAASTILHLSTTLLPNGTETISQIFEHEPDSYHSLYRQVSTPLIIAWLHVLEEGLMKSLHEQKKESKNYLVENTKKYIALHINERLSLSMVANIFSVSPNHLSQLFKKYNDCGFSEYITQTKIEESKKLLKQSNLKIYEVADQLGFENAFYFSKVFKKVTGVSPREYLNKG